MKGRVWRLLTGTSFVFHLGDSELAVTLGGLTGLETIALNGEVVSRRRSFSGESSHDIVVSGRAHNITISIKGDAIVTVTISVDGVHVQRQALIIPLLRADTVGSPFSGNRLIRWAMKGIAWLVGFSTYVFLKFEFADFGLLAIALGCAVAVIVYGLIYGLTLLPSEYLIEVQDGLLALHDEDQNDSR